MLIEEKRRRLYRRKKRIRAKIRGTSRLPRLVVYRSLTHIYAQIIDDEKGRTLLAAASKEVESQNISKPKNRGRKKELVAFAVGKLIAQKAKRRKIKQVVFDRGGRAYHGRVKALAEGAREGGLKF